MYFADRRHESMPVVQSAKMQQEAEAAALAAAQGQEWRLQRDRLKTISVSLVLCLNIGVDPPDIKALEAIGRNLQQQYEVWQPRARYRLSLDPSIEETKKLCCSLRRNAKDERILFHYNGHGVPKPTPGGEIWVLTRTTPNISPSAGNILVAFDKFATQRDSEMLRQHPELVRDSHLHPAGTNTGSTTGSTTNNNNTKNTTIGSTSGTTASNLASADGLASASASASAGNSNSANGLNGSTAGPGLSGINDLSNKITPSMIMRIPGKLADRRTPLGELNWIFTAITDTIAWSVLSPAMFQKLFRQDLMVAAISQLYWLIGLCVFAPDAGAFRTRCGVAASTTLPDSKTSTLLSQKKVEYKYSTFFAEQLSAFEVWLRKGAISRKPPQQLPIVLQVLLSQVHRLRALMLLSKFLDLGQWAVQLALSVGIFPYVLRLLQSPASELKPVLVFIWSKILAVDSSCQNDLIKDNGYTYFINILSADNNNMPVISNLSEHRAMCAFILAVFCHNYRFGQQACLKTDLLQALVPHLEDKDPLLRQWACVCLSELWKGYTDAKWAAVGSKIPEQLAMMLNDQVAEVRAAALAAIGTLFGDLEKTPAVLLIENKMAMMVLKCQADASALVRQELVVALSRFAHQYPDKDGACCIELIEDEGGDLHQRG
ncbi:hypothetical protein BSLG_009837 [Batrachochytrium salamandrivorans]|nr:hypothetical protein BSLG_009837 [Batrachochytrium salamandrivorans]